MSYAACTTRSVRWTPLNIISMVLGFVFFWPVGLVILFYILSGGDMSQVFERCGDWVRGRKNAHHGQRAHRAGGTGNSAFEEYREATLKRLQEEEAEFHAFMERLRKARDKEEFDRFMAERNATAN
jgi:hypothetical protein